MPGPQAPGVPRSAEERPARLTRIRAPQTPPHCSGRAHRMRHLAAGPTARAVARPVGPSRGTVRRWRPQGRARHAGAVAERGPEAPRPGAPAPCAVAPWGQRMACACAPPADSARPLSPWPPRAWAAEATQRGMGATRAERHVGRL